MSTVDTTPDRPGVVDAGRLGAGVTPRRVRIGREGVEDGDRPPFAARARGTW